MKELSMVRIIVAGLLLITVLIVCKRIWRQFFYSKKYKKYLSHLLEKENKYIYCRLRKLRRLQLDYSVRKLSCRKVCFRTFSDEEIDAIIFHEEYHQNNWDPLKLFCFTLLAEGMMYIPILKELLQRYHTYQELAADKYAMQKWNLHLS